MINIPIIKKVPIPINIIFISIISLTLPTTVIANKVNGAKIVSVKAIYNLLSPPSENLYIKFIADGINAPWPAPMKINIQ